MAQAIKQFNGVTYGSVSNQTDTVYTCPANTIAIVLPNCIFMPTYNGGSGAIGYNSSSLASYSNNGGSGNYVITGGDEQYGYQITHDDKHRVRIGLMNHTTNSSLYYSPNWTTNITNGLYAINENRNAWSSSQPHNAALVAGQMERGSSTNYPFIPSDFVAGTWVMGAGHKLTVNALIMRVQWSFLIIEEAA